MLEAAANMSKIELQRNEAEQEQSLILQENAIAVLARTIRQARKEVGLTQHQLAQRVFCHPGYIARLERLETEGPLPSRTRARTMEEVLKLEPDTLWKMVELARTQMDHQKVLIKNNSVVRAMQVQGLNPEATPAASQNSTLQFAGLLTSSLLTSGDERLDEGTAREIENILPALITVMSNPSRGRVAKMLLEGLAKEVDREQTKRH